MWCRVAHHHAVCRYVERLHSCDRLSARERKFAAIHTRNLEDINWGLIDSFVIIIALKLAQNTLTSVSSHAAPDALVLVAFTFKLVNFVNLLEVRLLDKTIYVDDIVVYLFLTIVGRRPVESDTLTSTALTIDLVISRLLFVFVFVDCIIVVDLLFCPGSQLTGAGLWLLRWTASFLPTSDALPDAAKDQRTLAVEH